MNDATTLGAFLSGKYLSVVESQRVIDTMVDKDIGIESYPELVQKAKKVLSSYELLDGGVICVDPYIEDLHMTEALKAVTVRLINLARHGNYLIAIGDEVKYLPEWMVGREVTTYLNLVKLQSALPPQAGLWEKLKHQVAVSKLIMTSNVE